MDGLRWRVVRRDDLAALVELANECCRTDGGLAFMNEPGNLRNRYFPDAPGACTGAFAKDGQLAACAAVRLIGKPGMERAVVVGQVRPDFRKRGIGTYLMKWSQAQAQVLFAAATVDKRVMQVATESLTDSADRLYRAHGLNPVFEELVMRRDLNLPLPEPPFPGDVTIKSWGPGLASRFFQAYESSFADRPGFPGSSAEEWIAGNTEDDDFRPEWSLLAEAGEVPVGFLTAGAGHPDAFIVQIGIIPEQRRRGLGSALTVETMRRMRAAGESAALLDVNVNNPGAIRAYVRLGFETVGRRARYERMASG